MEKVEEMLAEIEGAATERVDKRLADYNAARSLGHSDIISIAGIFTMGLVSDPRERQIKSYGLYLLSQALPDEQWRHRDPGAPR